MSQINDIEFAPATEADLPAVVELCMLVEEQHERYWPLRWQRREGLPEGYLHWFTKRLHDPRMFIGVARHRTAAGTPVVGTILATIIEEIPIYTFKEYALVQDMAVRPEYRRHGIASHLLADAAAWAKGHGVNQLRLMVADQNPDARAAFEKSGFRPTYQEMVLPL
jgi:GNAT superfamily N-acetyltransferase